MTQISETKNLTTAFAEESNDEAPRRTAEEWRRIEKEQTERDARKRSSSTVSLPKAFGA